MFDPKNINPDLSPRESIKELERIALRLKIRMEMEKQNIENGKKNLEGRSTMDGIVAWTLGDDSLENQIVNSALKTAKYKRILEKLTDFLNSDEVDFIQGEQYETTDNHHKQSLKRHLSKFSAEFIEELKKTEQTISSTDDKLSQERLESISRAETTTSVLKGIDTAATVLTSLTGAGLATNYAKKKLIKEGSSKLAEVSTSATTSIAGATAAGAAYATVKEIARLDPGSAGNNIKQGAVTGLQTGAALAGGLTLPTLLGTKTLLGTGLSAGGGAFLGAEVSMNATGTIDYTSYLENDGLRESTTRLISAITGGVVGAKLGEVFRNLRSENTGIVTFEQITDGLTGIGVDVNAQYIVNGGSKTFREILSDAMRAENLIPAMSGVAAGGNSTPSFQQSTSSVEDTPSPEPPIPVASTNKLDSGSPPTELATSSPSQEIVAWKQSTPSNNLLRNGFKRIVDSNIYIDEDYVITTDDNGQLLNIEVNFGNLNSPTSPIAAIIPLREQNSNGFSVAHENSASSTVTTLFNGGGGTYASEDTRRKLRAARNKPVTELLEDAGFSESPDSSQKLGGIRLFEFEVKEGGHSMPSAEKGDVIKAIVIDNEIIRITKPLSLETRRHILPDTQIVGRSTLDGRVGGPMNVIQLENSVMSFAITPHQNTGMGVDPATVELKRELTPAELQITEYRIRMEEGGFQVGGVNSSETIRGLTQLGGKSIEQLEQDMRPEALSHSGFIGKDESLVDVLAKDNNLVSSLGLTHTELAEPLIYVRALQEQIGLDSMYHTPLKFTYKGTDYLVAAYGWSGTQESPFPNMHSAGLDLVVQNTETGQRIQFSSMMPDLIQQYGFYQSTSYRVDPRQIAEVFGLGTDPLVEHQ